MMVVIVIVVDDGDDYDYDVGDEVDDDDDDEDEDYDNDDDKGMNEPHYTWFMVVRGDVTCADNAWESNGQTKSTLSSRCAQGCGTARHTCTKALPRLNWYWGTESERRETK